MIKAKRLIKQNFPFSPSAIKAKRSIYNEKSA